MAYPSDVTFDCFIYGPILIASDRPKFIIEMM